ncbi:hypothetical protein [Paludibacterium denitrificans]|uniref:hypothetical protein n=1 Tax=Paludibacterium denitrificans TaxID=2675226 RepID=UPI0024782C08
MLIDNIEREIEALSREEGHTERIAELSSRLSELRADLEALHAALAGATAVGGRDRAVEATNRRATAGRQETQPVDAKAARAAQAAKNPAAGL